MTRLIVFAGPPLSGKTTLATVISAELGIPHLSVDNISMEMNPVSDYSEEDRNANYDEMHIRARAYLERGDDVILDATYTRPETRGELDRLGVQTEAQMFLIECKVKPEVAAMRYRKREKGAHPAVDMSEERAFDLALRYEFMNFGIIIPDCFDIVHALNMARIYLGAKK